MKGAGHGGELISDEVRSPAGMRRRWGPLPLGIERGGGLLPLGAALVGGSRGSTGEHWLGGLDGSDLGGSRESGGGEGSDGTRGLDFRDWSRVGLFIEIGD